MPYGKQTPMGRKETNVTRLPKHVTLDPTQDISIFRSLSSIHPQVCGPQSELATFLSGHQSLLLFLKWKSKKRKKKEQKKKSIWNFKDTDNKQGEYEIVLKFFKSQFFLLPFFFSTTPPPAPPGVILKVYVACRLCTEFSLPSTHQGWLQATFPQ